MRASPLALSILLLAGPTACAGTGGSEGGLGETETFELVAATPADGAPTVPVTATVVLTFNVPLDPASVNSTTLSANHPLYGDLTVDGTKLRFDPSTDLLAGSTYVFSLSPDLKGLNGVGLATDPHYGFKTAGTLPPPPPDTVLLSRSRPR
jgi:hypothetical protein